MPGIIGVLLSMTMIIINAMSVVRERERGTLEQLIVTPDRPHQPDAGQDRAVPAGGLRADDGDPAAGPAAVRCADSGQPAALYLMAFPFMVASLGIGLFFSTLVRTQAQAMQAGFMFIMPNILLSGFMFPRAAMPEPAQWLGLLLPLTYFLEVLRGILLKGVGLQRAVARVAGAVRLRGRSS